MKQVQSIKCADLKKMRKSVKTATVDCYNDIDDIEDICTYVRASPIDDLNSLLDM